MSAERQRIRGFPGVLRKEYLGPDRDVVNEVFFGDCYRVGALPFPALTILDVGAHIGAAALKLRSRFLCSAIICAEANPLNIPVLEENVAPSGIRVVAGAVGYREDSPHLYSTVFPGTGATGGSFLGKPGLSDPHYQDIGRVPQHTVEQIMEDEGWTTLDLLKLDCEGSELDILEHMDISRVGTIVGEWHSRAAFLELVDRKFPRDVWSFDILKDSEIGLFRLGQRRWWNMEPEIRGTYPD